MPENSSDVTQSTGEAADARNTSGQAPAPRNQTDVVESKTNKTSATESSTDPTKPLNTTFASKDAPKFLRSTERNILHNYRSWTYNWALAALTPQALSDQSLLERDIRTYPVLNSAGKGTRGLGINTGGLNERESTFEETKKLVEGFNTKSAGRFDMFIDNVSVDSIIGHSQQGGSSIATNIGFEVYEPLSMNGFIEALQAAAKAAGYSDYMKGVFALRIQFQGYPDTSTGTEAQPEVIPRSTRYFLITITEVDVDVTEQGTRYRISAVPAPQMALGISNVLTSDIKIAGDTVGDVLKNFFEAINKMVEDRTRKQVERYEGQDKYEISCPALVSVGSPQNTKAAVLNGTTSTTFTSEIVKAQMVEELKAASVFKMGDPAQFKNGYVAAVVPGSTATNATSNPSTGKLNPKTNTVVFAAGSNIHDCISAVVRDSQYTRDLLKPENLDKVKQGNGEVTYFSVRTEIELLNYDTVNNKYFTLYRYVLEPYQIHYTRIPGQEFTVDDYKDVKAKIKREYNYIYTGKNEDVLKFQLKFDNLYYNAIPAALGGRQAAQPKSEQAAPANGVEVKQEKSEAVGEQRTQSPSSVPMASSAVNPSANTFNQEAKAGLPQGDPYAILAQNLHNAILNNVALVQGTLEILGDPYYLVTGGMGNTNLTLAEPALTRDGQAPITQGDVYINVNFRNPVDINPNTGLVDFGENPVSFSGIYRVTELKNHFKDGVFTQGLQILRMAGQLVGKGEEILSPSGTTRPQPGQQTIRDTSPASILRSGIRPNDFNLQNLLSRGLPSPGLPGNVSNFTNALTGPAAAGAGILNQVAGLTNSANALTRSLGISPVAGIDQLTSGIRLSASGLGEIGAIAATGEAAITAAGKLIGNAANIPNAATKLASNVVDSVASLPQTLVAASSSILPGVTGQASTFVNTVKNLAGGAVDQVTGLIGNAKSSIASLQNTMPIDINAVGSKLGIDTSALAGLPPDLKSKMANELQQVAESVPADVDLGRFKEQGLAFSNLTKETIGNLPPIQPKVAAPGAGVDPNFEEIIKRNNGSLTPLLAGRTNLANLTDVNKITNPLGTVASGFGSVGSLSNTVGAAQRFVNNTIGSSVGLTNNIGSLAQNTVQGINPANLGIGSVESNFNTVNSLVQNQSNNLGVSVTSQFGSKQASPLAKLIQDNNIIGSA